MKKIFLLLTFVLLSIAGFSQGFKTGGIFLRVTDSATYVNSAYVTAAHADNYADIFYSTASQLFWKWNGSAYEQLGSGSGGGVWGTITGTLSDQTDLQAALDLKAPLVSPTFTTPTLGVASATGRAYNASTWDGSARVPTEDDIRDKIETLVIHPIEFAATDQVTPISASAGKWSVPIPAARTITSIVIYLITPQASGSIFTVDLNENGNTILSTKATIDNTEANSTTAATPMVISDSSLAANSILSVDVDQIGNGTAMGLWVVINLQWIFFIRLEQLRRLIEFIKRFFHA